MKIRGVNDPPQVQMRTNDRSAHKAPTRNNSLPHVYNRTATQGQDNDKGKEMEVNPKHGWRDLTGSQLSAIREVWRWGKSDTLDIARRFWIPESQAYHIISNRAPPVRRATYAGKE